MPLLQLLAFFGCPFYFCGELCGVALNFLDHAFHGALDGVEYIDTMWIEKTLLDLPNYKLETVADYAEFHPQGGYHDSLTDCTAMAAVFFWLAFDKLGLAKTYHSNADVKEN